MRVQSEVLNALSHKMRSQIKITLLASQHLHVVAITFDGPTKNMGKNLRFVRAQNFIQRLPTLCWAGALSYRIQQKMTKSTQFADLSSQNIMVSLYD